MTLTRIFIDLESVSDGLSEIWDEMSRKHRKFKGFFRPKLGDLQKKKKKKKKKKVFAKIQSDFSPKFRKFKRLRGGSFRMGGAIFHFSQKIGFKSTIYMRFCILHKPMGGARAPPAPPLATLLVTNHLYENSDHKIDFAKPKILGTARNRTKLFILESLSIEKPKPDISVDQLSITLYLFNTWYCFFPLFSFSAER